MNKKGILGMDTAQQFTFGMLTLVILGVLSIVIITLFAATRDVTTESSNSQNILANNGTSTTLIGVPTSISVTEKNTTWLEFDGNNDAMTLTVTQSKATIALWFKNTTTPWTSLIRSDGDTYINGVINATWVFFPYFIGGDVITVGKSDASTFLNVSIDEFRVYETALNQTEVTTVFEEGR